MSSQIKRRSGTTVEHSTFTGAAAEITVDTTLNTIVVHDGATAGGIVLARMSDTGGGGGAATNLAYTTGASTGIVTSSDGTDATLPAATTSLAGLLTGADKTLLDAIEASADVTDTANVTAAGALMDSEVTNLADVKAFDTTDYATSAQGTTADAALPKAGGALTGNVTTTGTFDGRDVATDGTKLDTITIGSTVQAFDADTAKTDVTQTYTASQRGAVTALTDAASIATDLALSNNYSVTLAGNRTLVNPTNCTAGQSGSIFITQDATGSRTLAYGGYFKFVGGTAPVLTTTANSICRIDYAVKSATEIHAVASLDVK
jgi:hypothetical protein